MASNQKSSLIKPLIIAASIPFIILGLKTANDIRRSAAIIPANIAIDAVNSHGTISPVLWQNLAQGGEEATDMIGPIVPLVRQLQPKLIRIDHLFDYYQVYQGPNNYNFSQLDQVIDSIIATGAKPLLSISYTPANMTTNGQVAGAPADWSQWSSLVQATAYRYSQQRQIDGIYYEVWNEPDLFGGWHYGKDPSYSTLYLQTSRAIVSGAGDAKYKIGGPATTNFYPNWFRSLFTLCTDNRLKLDFISWHRYTKNMDELEKDLDQLNTILMDFPYFYGLERLITETGPNSEPDSWYDNSLSGIHLISSVTRLSGKIHRIFPFEIVDGPANRGNSTGWGMITHPTRGAQPKPRYQAIKFLNQFSGLRLGITGNGTYVSGLAAKKDDSILILLTNYNPTGQNSETFPLKIIGLYPGNYNIKRTDYLGATTNRQITVTSHLYQESFYLEPNTATLLEITHP